MSSSQYHGVAVAATILSISSILGSCWIIHAALKRKRKDMNIDEYRKDYIVTDYVLYMSICDVGAHIMILLYYSAVSAKSPWVQNVGENLFPLCWIFGFIIQFSLLSSATWSFAIALNLWWLMNGVEYEELIPETWNICWGISIKKHKVIIVYFALFFSGLASGNYGLTSNADDIVIGGKYECWIQHTGWQMVLYGPVSIYVVVTFTILCKIILIKCKCLRSNNPIQNKLALYSALFSFIWVWPCINRYWGFSNSDPHWGIVAMHHILLSSIGLGNFFIWTCRCSKPSSLGIGMFSNSDSNMQGTRLTIHEETVMLNNQDAKPIINLN